MPDTGGRRKETRAGKPRDSNIHFTGETGIASPESELKPNALDIAAGHGDNRYLL